MSQVVVDASLVLKLVLPEDLSDVVALLWDDWVEQETELVAPLCFAYEAVSAIRSNVTRKIILPEAADIAFQDLLTQIEDVNMMEPSNLHIQAWEIAKVLKQGQ